MSWLNCTKNLLLKLSSRIKDNNLKSPIGSYLLRLPPASLTSSTSASPWPVSWPSETAGRGPLRVCLLCSLCWNVLPPIVVQPVSSRYATVCHCHLSEAFLGRSVYKHPPQHSPSLLAGFIFIFSPYSQMFLFKSQLTVLPQREWKFSGDRLSPALALSPGTVLAYRSCPIIPCSVSKWNNLRKILRFCEWTGRDGNLGDEFSFLKILIVF